MTTIFFRCPWKTNTLSASRVLKKAGSREDTLESVITGAAPGGNRISCGSRSTMRSRGSLRSTSITASCGKLGMTTLSAAPLTFHCAHDPVRERLAGLRVPIRSCLACPAPPYGDKQGVLNAVFVKGELGLERGGEGVGFGQD